MKNKYDIRGDLTAVYLARRDGTVYETIIDTADLPHVKSMPNTWFVCWSPTSRTFYVAAYCPKGKRTNISLHRWIMGEPFGKLIDHINHDTLDNRRSNLRAVSATINQLNRKQAQLNNKSSGVRGVYFNQTYQKWHARLQAHGKRKHLGYFDRLSEARVAVERELSKFV